MSYQIISDGADENIVVVQDDSIYRLVPKVPKDVRWAKTNKFLESKIFTELQDLRYIPKHFQSGEDEKYIWYNVETIPFLIRPEEMVDHQKTSILGLVCEINSMLCDTEWELTEGHLWNFTFLGSKPVLLDIGAIDHLKSRRIYSRECILRGAESCDDPIILNFVNSLPAILSKDDWDNTARFFLEYNRSYGENPWDTYNKDFDRQLPYTVEQKRLLQWFEEYPISTMVDVAGNDGVFSRLATMADIQPLCCDNAKNALLRGFTHAVKSELDISFAVIDLTDDLEDTGLHDCHYHANWYQRFRSDLVFMSSIIHHLLKSGMSLEKIAGLIDSLGDKYAAIEFIDSDDVAVSGWFDSTITFDRLLQYLPSWERIDSFDGYEGPGFHRTWHLLRRI